MIRVVPYETLSGSDTANISIRDHFRGTIENHGKPSYGLGALRVLADTRISPQSGFPMHEHKNFEIITFVVSGTLSHEDTTGAKGLLNEGDVQVMTTGAGVRHSEINASNKYTRVYQMWFYAEKLNLKPSYADLIAPPLNDQGNFTVYASGAPHIVGLRTINQNVAVMGTRLEPGYTSIYKLCPDRRAYILAVDGPLVINNVKLPAQGGAELCEEAEIHTVVEDTPSRVVLIDVAKTFENPEK
jgi:redox-sensitive bicupin YhaK (pirin superfamily)